MPLNDDSNDERTSGQRRGLSGKMLALIIGGAIVVIVLICGGMGVATYTGNITKGNTMQNDLTATYADAANYMSNCIVKTNQAANVAQANADAFDKVIKDAIAGNGKAGQFNLNTQQGQAGFFPLLVQAYPQLQGQTDLFKKVLTIIVGCQDDFRNKQSVVLDHVRTFNNWRQSFWTSLFGGGNFPNDNLVINLPGVPMATGQAALLKMGQPIIATDASDAYKNGTYTPSNPFPGGNSSSAPATPAPSHS
jgi:hypothetical protein